jgi:polycomb protein EED
MISSACGEPLYDTEFNPVHSSVCAAVGAQHLYIIHANNTQIIQTYVDAHSKEILYTVTWITPTILAIAGALATIKIIDTNNLAMISYMQGHGADIYQLRLHPHNSDIILSASKDKSARIWSIKHSACIAILAGDQGHQEEVLSADFDLQGKVITSGMDHQVKIWQLDNDVTDFIDGITDEPPRRAKCIQFPIYSSNKIHGNYVDYVRSYGTFILSKSIEEKIILWKPIFGSESVRNYLVYYT